jgi:hypothetical protein
MEWLDQLATTFGVDPLGPGEANDLLDAARDVAHGVERKITPLASFLLGMRVAGRMGDGVPREQALAETITELRSTM